MSQGCFANHDSFNPRPREGGDARRHSGCRHPQSFNPRPREGGDLANVSSSISYLVSIHAPAKGATVQRPSANPTPKVSIHAPAKGATQQIEQQAAAAMVSIHAPAKGATQVDTKPSRSRHVSIHAPAKGATPRAVTQGHLQRSFNPRPREGGDDDHLRVGQGFGVFQSTPPRRGRPVNLAGKQLVRGVSIHAPAKGATWSFPGCQR